MDSVKNNPASDYAPSSGDDHQELTERFKAAVGKKGDGADHSSHGGFGKLQVLRGDITKPQIDTAGYLPPPLPTKPLPPGSPVIPGAPRPLPPKTEEDDPAVDAYIKSLGSAVTPAEKKQLEQIGNDAQTLLDFFNAYPNGSPQLNHNIPPAVAAAEKRLLSVAAIRKQLVNGSGPQKGLVTRYTVSKFLDSLNNAAKSAQSSWASFKSAAPNASAAKQRIAVDASLLQAYLPVMDDASTHSKVDGLINTNNLETTANSAGDSSLPNALKDAAALFADHGMFANVDQAGGDIATTPADGLADTSNFGSFVSSIAPQLGRTSLIQMLGAAANSDMVQGVNISKLGPDVFKNPQNYSPAQKAAVLQQLENLQLTMDAGVKEGDWDNSEMILGGRYANTGINPDAAAVQANIQRDINTLQQDPSVQRYIGAHSAASMQNIVDADPGLKSAMQKYFNGPLQNGSALKGELDGKGSTQQGLASYINTVTMYAQALGSNGKPAKIDLQQAAQKSGEQGKLEQYYQKNILSGGELKSLIANGSDIGQATQQFMSDAANFSAVLPPNYVKQNAAKLQDNFSNTLSTSLLGTATKGELDKAFADKNGNLDVAKLKSDLQQIEKRDPGAFKDSNGTEITPDKIVSVFKYVWDEFRQSGGKLPDSLSKIKVPATLAKMGVTVPGKPTGPIAKAYSSGMMHIVSSLLGAGVLAAKSAEGGSSGIIAANSIASGFQVAGGLMEGGSKYAKSYLKSKPWVPSGSTLKSIESAGKTLGGIGGVVAGGVSIFGGVQALESGDKVDGGVDLSTGITQVLSGSASAVEGIAGLAGADDATLAALGATSSILGGVAAGVGAFAFFGLEAYQLVEETKDNEAFMGQVIPQIKQWGTYGATGPYLQTSPPQSPYVPPLGIS